VMVAVAMAALVVVVAVPLTMFQDLDQVWAMARAADKHLIKAALQQTVMAMHVMVATAVPILAVAVATVDHITVPADQESSS